MFPGERLVQEICPVWFPGWLGNESSSGDMSSLVPRWLGNESSSGNMSSLAPRWLGNESSSEDMSKNV